MVWTRIQTSWAKRDEEPQYDEMAMTHLERPTLDSAAFISAAQTALQRIFKHGYAYAKVMVMLTELSDPAKSQGNLRDFMEAGPARAKKRAELLALVDRINRVDGRGTIRFASQGAPDAAWHMKRDRLSPAWTTDSQEMLQIGGNYLEQFHACL